MNDSLSEYRVEEKVSKIKLALQKLGAAFIASDPSQDDTAKMNSSYTESAPQSWGRRSSDFRGYSDQTVGSDSMGSPKFQIPGSGRTTQFNMRPDIEKEWTLKPGGHADDFKPMLDPTASIMYKKSLNLTDGRASVTGEAWELSVMLETERERMVKLENQLNYKESLLEESLKLQQELYSRLEDSRQQSAQLEEKFEREYSELESSLRSIEAKNSRLEKENSELKANLGRGERDTHQVRELKLHIQELESRLHKQRKGSLDADLQRHAERGDELNLLRGEVQRLEKELKVSQSAETELQAELLNTQKERNRLARNLDDAAITASHETESFKNRLEEAATRSGRYQVEQLMKEVDSLKSENETLREKLKTTWKDLKDLEKRQDVHRGRHRMPKPDKTYKKTTSRSRSSTPSKVNIKELCSELDVQSFKEALQATRNLKARLARLSPHVKFAERVSELVKSTTSVEKAPSLKALYKWIARVIDDYYVIKKKHETHSNGCEVIQRLLALSELEHAGELPAFMSKVLNDRVTLKHMIGQIKDFVA